MKRKYLTDEMQKNSLKDLSSTVRIAEEKIIELQNVMHKSFGQQQKMTKRC